MSKEAPRNERFVISAAQAEAKPHRNLLRSLKTYTEAVGGKMIILPLIGRDAKQDWTDLDPAFADMDVEYGQRKLNDNIQLAQFHVRPYQIDPVVGLNRFVQRETTQVFASPKQRLKPVAHSTRHHPKFLVTTGAVTEPNYATTEDTSAERRRLGEIAKRDHTYGGVVVEVKDNNVFYMRHITANKGGKFVDLGTSYDGEEVNPAACEALVLGDYHCGRTDPDVLEATYKMIDDLKPERIVLHDFFDGHSVSHHAEKQLIQQGILQIQDYGHESLEQELKQCNDELRVLSGLSPQVVVVMSNHHEFLWRYLDEGRFMRDKENARLGFKLASHMAEADENDPVSYGIELVGGKLPKNIKFLKRTDDYRVHGYQLGAHGDKGAGFGYGSMVGKENDYGQSISGHVHSAQTLRNTHTVGTMLPLDMFYLRGSPHSWTNSHAALYENGKVQHHILFKNDYRLRDKK